jgi:hypothetical protein
MRLVCTPQARARLNDALLQMKSALDILDQVAGPGEIGALLDLAISRLGASIGRDDERPTRVQAMIVELERELAATPVRIGTAPDPWPHQPI